MTRSILLHGPARVFAALAFTAITAFASTNNCPTSTGTIAKRTFSGAGAPTYNNITVPGDSLTNNLTSVNALNSGAGCTTIDLTFSNVAVTNAPGGANEGNLPFAAGTYVSLTPTGTTGIGSDTLLFSTLQGDGSGNPESATAPTANDGVDNFKVNTSESFTTTMSYVAVDSVGTGILGLVLSVNDITVATGGSGSVTIDTCSTGTTAGETQPTGAITSQAACNTAVGLSGSNGKTGVFSSTTITLQQLALQTALLSFTNQPVDLDVTQIITLTCTAACTGETGFLTFSNEFEETPEPSAFALLGTALALTGIQRFRVSRKRR